MSFYLNADNNPATGISSAQFGGDYAIEVLYFPSGAQMSIPLDTLFKPTTWFASANISMQKVRSANPNITVDPVAGRITYSAD